jgi:serine protease Do
MSANPRLGANVQDSSGEMSLQRIGRNTRGALVVSLLPDSPAAKAGLQVGDVIVQVDGARVLDATDLVVLARIAQAPLQLTFYREATLKSLLVE